MTGPTALTSRWRPLKTTAKAPCPIRSLRENSNLPTVSRPPRPGSMARAGRAGRAGRAQAAARAGGGGLGARAIRQAGPAPSPAADPDSTPIRPGPDWSSDSVLTKGPTRFRLRLQAGSDWGSDSGSGGETKEPRRLGPRA